MLFFGRIDESDTHGREPDMVMSAMLGRGDAWRKVRRGLNSLRKRYGFTIFHGAEFHALGGEFKGWSDSKCEGLLYEAGRLIDGTLTECITVTLSYEVYKKYFLEVRPAKMHRTSQYGICFLAVLDAMTKYAMECGQDSKLSVIIESGHPNASDTGRLFQDRKDRWLKEGVDFYRSHTLVRKEVDPSLMLSDMVAYGSAHEARVRKAGFARPFTDSPGARRPRPGETGWTVSEITAQYMSAIIQDFNDGKAAAQAEYVRRREAWLAKKAAEGNSGSSSSPD